MEGLTSMLQQTLAGAGSMESRYIATITLLDQAETLANVSVQRDGMHHRIAVQLAETKQAVITDFARANETLTLTKIRQRAEEAAKIHLEEITK